MVRADEYELLHAADGPGSSELGSRMGSSSRIKGRFLPAISRYVLLTAALLIFGVLYLSYSPSSPVSPYPLSTADRARVIPFLPFVCPHEQYPSAPLQRASTSDTYSKGKDPLLDSHFLDRSKLFAGTGAEVRRVLGRAISRVGVDVVGSREKPREFKILILGGSISICHGLAQADCWPNLIKDYFHANFDGSSSLVPVTDMINLSQPATGSSYFGYCYSIEQKLRAGGRLDTGPDLVVIEFGINDVWPLDDVAKKDVERLLRVLRGLPSTPAVIMLDAASLKLATTFRTEQNAESLHLPAAQFYDVPVLSMKAALFGSSLIASEEEANRFSYLFQDDRSHPNPAGHRVMLDILTTYIEEQACIEQARFLSAAVERVGATASMKEKVEIDRAVDVGGREREVLRPMPSSSLFKLVADPSRVPSDQLAASTCLAVGMADAKIVPAFNSGWRSFFQQSDKQYLLADEPGSLLKFDIDVGKGGSILVDFLRSQYYDLGEAAVTLDGNSDSSVIISGSWDLEWSIGVPTEVFSDVPEGRHSVSFELLPSKIEGKATSFRLIALIFT